MRQLLIRLRMARRAAGMRQRMPSRALLRKQQGEGQYSGVNNAVQHGEGAILAPPGRRSKPLRIQTRYAARLIGE